MISPFFEMKLALEPRELVILQEKYLGFKNVSVVILLKLVEKRYTTPGVAYLLFTRCWRVLTIGTLDISTSLGTLFLHISLLIKVVLASPFACNGGLLTTWTFSHISPSFF